MPPLIRSATVCALVPHHDCATWLAGAVQSLLAQTRPPDAIVVLDDASPEPPWEVAHRYPEVTVLRSAANVGPYRLVQTAIDQTDFDAYLFQDADDLSHPERLATLLEVAEAQGADIVGSHETELDVVAPEARGREYPLDVNAALADNPIAFALLHPTSLVGRDALVRAGGFPGGLRFSGDVDFLWRAGHVARIVNADRHLYLRRRHRRSLTGAAATGTRSGARQRVDSALRARARATASAVAAGAAPDLSPFVSAPPAAFEHLSGPSLRPRRSTSPGPRPPVIRAHATATGPVLVVGGPRNGGDVLACALDLHPRLQRVADDDDVSRVAATGRRPVLAGPGVAARALRLADAHPDAKVVWIERDPAATVASLVARPDAHGNYYSGRSARAAAAELGSTCELLAAALGPERMTRMSVADLVEDPATAVLSCLAFLGEEPVEGIDSPLVGLAVAGDRRPGAGGAAPPGDARRLLQERSPAADDTLAARLRHLLAGVVHDDAVVAVVSRGDPSLLDLGAGRARHFPSTEDGSYAGEYPATGAAAVAVLEAARARGATHLLVPAPAAWWLSHYRELRGHLHHHYRAVAGAEETGTLYELAVRSIRRAAS